MTNAEVFQSFLTARNPNAYGHSVCVHNGVLYSAALQIWRNQPIKHLDEAGNPSGTPMGAWEDGCLLIGRAWSGCITSNQHVKALSRAVEEFSFPVFNVREIVSESASFASKLKMHTSNIEMYRNWCKANVSASETARKYSFAYAKFAAKIAVEAEKYAKTFGFSKDADAFQAVHKTFNIEEAKGERDFVFGDAAKHAFNEKIKEKAAIASLQLL